MWVSRHPLNNSLAIFIHGLIGSRWHTWRSYVDLFQAIATDIWPSNWQRLRLHLTPDRKTLMRNYDVYLFNYETRTLHQAPLQDFVKDLKDFVDRHAEHYDTIVLVGHSQGGLLGKLYILAELAARNGQNMKVDGIITLNTPHRGARWMYQVFLFFGFPLRLASISGKSPLRQFFDLTCLSRNTRFLRKNWNKNVILSKGAPSTLTTRHITSLAVRTRKDCLVSLRSADGFGIDKQVHVDVGDSHSVDSPQVAFKVGELLSQHLDPVGVEVELNEIYADVGRRSFFRTQSLSHAIAIIKARHPSVAAGYLQRKAACLVDEFPRAFRQRPLRNLDLPSAFRTYVRKALGI